MFLIRNQFYYIYTTNERKSSMNVVENEIVKKISRKHNKKEEMISLMLEKYKKLGYNIKDFENDCNTYFYICY
jgi:hypothetical protein